MPFLRTSPDEDPFLSQQARRPRASLLNSLRHARHHRRHSAPTTQVSTHPCSNPAAHLKPIYIYPGLLRIVREKAIALDNQCPAVHYKCHKCNEQSPSSPHAECEHAVRCSICLDRFHGKDLVRRLPCDANHMFHSKCILDWLAFQQRCPLCNKYISNSLQICASHGADSSGVPLGLHRRSAEDRRDIRQRLLRFFGVDINLARFTREVSHVPPANRPLRADVGDIFCPSSSNPEQGRFHSSPPIGQQLNRENERDSSENSRASGTNSTSSDTNRCQQRSKGPRTYSYIMHDNVRMEMNACFPV